MASRSPRRCPRGRSQAAAMDATKHYFDGFHTSSDHREGGGVEEESDSKGIQAEIASSFLDLELPAQQCPVERHRVRRLVHLNHVESFHVQDASERGQHPREPHAGDAKALRWLGRDHGDDRLVATLRRRLSDADKRQLLQDLRYAPTWVADILRSVAAPSVQ